MCLCLLLRAAQNKKQCHLFVNIFSSPSSPHCCRLSQLYILFAYFFLPFSVSFCFASTIRIFIIILCVFASWNCASLPIELNWMNHHPSQVIAMRWRGSNYRVFTLPQLQLTFEITRRDFLNYIHARNRRRPSTSQMGEQSTASAHVTSYLKFLWPKNQIQFCHPDATGDRCGH